MLKQVLRIIFLTLLLGYLLAAGILYTFWRPEPTYRAVKVCIDYPNDEAHFVTEQGILDLLNSKPGFKFQKLGYADVNTLELSQYIEEKNQLVRHAYCFHTPDSILRIDVEQRSPVLRVKSDIVVKGASGRQLTDFYIDHDGEMMPALGGNAVHLPIATGYIRPADIQPLRDFALFLKGNDFWSNEITQIYVRRDGEIELIPRIGDHRILIGDFSNIERKLKKVRKFYAEVLPRKGWNAYSVIDVKFDGQIIGEK